MKKLLFLCIASGIVIFTVIVLNVSPAINLGLSDWYDESCQKYADNHKYTKEKSLTELGLTQELKDEVLDFYKEGKTVCERHKAMVGLEYASLNINVVCGFTCAVLGLLLYLNVGNNIAKITGLIGLGSGAIAFVLTFVYIVESGIIFTQDVVGKDYDNSFGSEYGYNTHARIDSDGAFLEWDDSRKSYVCIFYKKDKKDSLYRRYSDYGNKYLNYNSDIEFATEKKNYKYTGGCAFPNEPNTDFHLQDSKGVSHNFYESCKLLDEKDTKYNNGNDEKISYYSSPPSAQKEGDCDKIFYIDSSSNSDYTKQNEYDKYVTSLVLGCFIILLDIGLALFGFLIFKEGNGGSGSVAIK